MSFLHDDNLSFFSQFVYFDFIRMTIDVTRKTRCHIYYNRSFKVTHDLYLKIEKYHAILFKGVYKIPFNDILHMNLETNDYSVELLNHCNIEFVYISFKYEQEEGEQISLFGINVTIPKLSYTLTNVKLKICSNHENIKSGDLVEIELIPTDNCECIIEKIPNIRKDGESCKVGIVEQQNITKSGHEPCHTGADADP